jgi:hypothetical protein
LLVPPGGSLLAMLGIHRLKQNHILAHGSLQQQLFSRTMMMQKDELEHSVFTPKQKQYALPLTLPVWKRGACVVREKVLESKKETTTKQK